MFCFFGGGNPKVASDLRSESTTVLRPGTADAAARKQVLDAHVSFTDKMGLYSDTHLRHSSLRSWKFIYQQITGLISALESESTDWECMICLSLRRVHQNLKNI